MGRCGSDGASRLDGELDDRLSMRPLELDPLGYFIVSIDHTNKDIVAEHYTNTINDKGDETGQNSNIC